MPTHKETETTGITEITEITGITGATTTDAITITDAQMAGNTDITRG
jgi:hypothetical protein